MKRLVSILLLISMLLIPLTACSGDSGAQSGSSGTTASTTADPNVITTYLEPLDEAIKELDYGGERFVILSRESSAAAWESDQFVVEELTNEPINDAVYNRNLAVSETLGVEIVQEVSGIEDSVGKMVNSGDTTYDLVAGSVYYSTSMLLSGYLYNLYDNGIETYLDTEKPWWPQYWIEQAEVLEKLYLLTGPASLTLTRSMMVMYYNKTMGANYGIENLYEVVNDGKWTIDYFDGLVASIYRDLNGNDQKDMEDEYGFATNTYVNADIFWSAFDMSMVAKDSDGWFELASDKEKISKAFDKVYNLFYYNTGTYAFSGKTNDDFDRLRDMFSSGSVLLSPIQLYYAETTEFRNMQDEYGILPMPKFDEAQDNYYTYAHDQYSVFMIPCTVKDPKMSGAVLETMTYESYKSLQPTYYDIVLKGRYANDIESRRMLDMITENLKVDCGWIYARVLDDATANVFRNLIDDKKTSFASSYAMVENSFTRTTNKLKKVMALFDY